MHLSRHSYWKYLWGPYVGLLVMLEIEKLSYIYGNALPYLW